MQVIRSSCCDDLIEPDGPFIAAVRGFAWRCNFFARGLSNLVGRMSKPLRLSPAATLASRGEVAIMYFGRTSEFLMVTSERMVIPAGGCTLGQLLRSLHKRGGRWADELDDSHLLCTVNGLDARLFDTIEAGAEVSFASTKSIFEA